MKLDILAFAAHPDDTELACSATLYTHIKKGYKVGVIDLTEGELGTRGSVEIRYKEAEASKKLLGLSIRENLQLQDGFFEINKENKLTLVRSIRKYRPDIVLMNAPNDRHPDHGRAAQLQMEALFISGLEKVKTGLDGVEQAPWRPPYMYHYIQSLGLTPDFIVDVSEAWEMKMKAIKCFESQFYDPQSNEPETYISSPEFMKLIEARGKDLGHSIGASYGEGFIKVKPMGITDLYNLK